MLGYSGRFRTFAPTDFLSGKAMARTGLRMMPTRTDPACPRAQAAVASNPRSDPIRSSTQSSAHALILSTIPSGNEVGPPLVHRRCKAVRDRSHAVQQLSQSPRPAPE